MKTLDVLLYRWFGEADESRAEPAFRAYYSAAFPSLVRHVQHRTGWDPAAAEDIAQEALLRFFERAGRGRRDALAAISAAANRLTEIEHGAFRWRSFARWAADVSALADSVVKFRPPPDDAVANSSCRSSADQLSFEIASLERKGWTLLDEARRALRRFADGRSADESQPTAIFPATGEAVSPGSVDESEIAELAGEFARELPLEPSLAGRVEQHFPGMTQRVQSALTIIETLPRLRMPTNGYLFEIATSTFLDEIKRQRRRKRGGAQRRESGLGSDPSRAVEMTGHPLEAVPEEVQSEHEHEDWSDHQPTREHRGYSRAATGMPELYADPVSHYEGEEFLQRFYEYLRSPVARLVDALEAARARGRAAPEYRKLERVSRKFSRMMTVLSLMGQGYTQEETALITGLSRNQVKYIVQTVKEAYARFAADEPCVLRSRGDREGESHVS